MTSDEVNSVIMDYEHYPKHWTDHFHEEDGAGKSADETEGEMILKESLFELGCRNGVMWAKDDITGADLDPKLVTQARELEMDYFRKMRVYDKVPRAVARGKPTVKTLWIDIEKKDHA